MRKWICILLAAGIAAGLMSGCSRNVGTQESAVWQVLETEILAEKADASGEVDFTHDYSEEIKADIEDVVSKSESLQKELEQINTIIQKFTPLAEKAETQGEMNASSRWFYVIWDTELNNLWSRFMNLADQKTKESVLAEQRNWVAMKEEATLLIIGSSEENGSIYPLLQNSFLEEITKNRACVLASKLAGIKGEDFMLPDRSNKYGLFIDNQGIIYLQIQEKSHKSRNNFLIKMIL